MSKLDGCYVREADSAVFWAVDKGKRRMMSSINDVYELGLRPIHVLSEAELEKIPIAGMRKAASPKAEDEQE